MALRILINLFCIWTSLQISNWNETESATQVEYKYKNVCIEIP